MWTLLSKIKINPLFWVVIGIGVVTGYFREVVMLFSIVFIHEMGHAIAAHHFKWRIHKIELLPFGGVAEVENAGNRPFHEEFIVIVAGPLQHIWMMLLSYGFLQLSFWTVADHRLFIWHNIMILGFNLIPVLPLDGGRIIQLFFTYRYSYAKALHYSLRMSTFVLIAMILMGSWLFPFHLNLWIILSFLVITNYLEWKQRHYRFICFLMDRYSNQTNPGQSRYSVVQVKDSMRLREVMKKCRRGHNHLFEIHRLKSGSSIIVKEEELLHVLFEKKTPLVPLSSLSFTEFRHD